jgi:membrane protease YdiL (CAAX protease family)
VSDPSVESPRLPPATEVSSAPTAPTSPTSPTAPALAERPRRYHEALSEPRRPWWVAALALISFALAILVVSLLLSFLAIQIDLLLGLTTPDAVTSGALVFTPTLFLANNLVLAALIPISMLLQWAFFGVRPRWMFSVTGMWRWHLVRRSALFIVPIFLLYTGAGLALAAAELITTPPSGTTLALLVMVVLTTPLQAAGEEFGFRGFVTRTVGAWSARSGVSFALGTIASSITFALVHFAADPWLIAYYLVFAVAMSLIVRATGGLEIAVLIHVLNNVLLLVPAVVLSSLDESFDRSVGSAGPVVLVPMAIIALITVIVMWWAPRRGVVSESRGSAS